MKTAHALWICLPLFLAVMLIPRAAEAQATFQPASTANVVTANGHAELSGDVTLTISGGTSAAGRLELTYPVPFANDAATGISLIGTGGLAAATMVVAASSSIVSINVPAGATLGASLKVRGVRFSAVANNTTAMSAKLSSTGNFISSGRSIVSVVKSAAAGFSFQSVSGPSFRFSNGVIVSGAPDLQILEGYEASFTSAVGQLGQTSPTQIIFRITGLPDNVTVTFPTTVFSNTGATLSTGTPVTLTNQSATDRVVYAFGESATSQAVLDGFTVTPVIGTTGPAGTGTTFIQVGLGPIGAAVPDMSLPSTAIPRFSENFIPALSSIPGAILSLTFPTSSLETDETIAVSNLGSGGAGLVFRATRSDGSSATSTLSPVLPGRGTSLFSISQLFGTAGSPASLSSIQVDTLNNNQLIGAAIASAPGGRAIARASAELRQFILPLNLTSSTRDATITIINSGIDAADITLVLRTASGLSISSIVRQVPSGTTLRDGLLSLFAVPATSIPANAYVDGTSTAPVRVSAFANPQGPVEKIQGIATSIVRTYRYPYFVTGGGYESVLTLINRSSFPLQVTLTPLQITGLLFTATNPATRILGVAERIDIDVSTLVPATSSLTVGSLIVNAERAGFSNPFSTPQLAGTMRTKTASSSAVIPLFLDLLTESSLIPALESATTYTGIAFTNESGRDANVTVEVYSGAGPLIGSKTFLIGPQGTRAQLLRELVPASLGQLESRVRISSTVPIGVIAFRGGLNSSELLYLQPQQ